MRRDPHGLESARSPLQPPGTFSLGPPTSPERLGRLLGTGACVGEAYLLLDLVPASKNFGLRDGRACVRQRERQPPARRADPTPGSCCCSHHPAALSARDRMPRGSATPQMEVEASSPWRLYSPEAPSSPPRPVSSGEEGSVAPETFCPGRAGHSPDSPSVLGHAFEDLQAHPAHPVWLAGRRLWAERRGSRLLGHH